MITNAWLRDLAFARSFSGSPLVVAVPYNGSSVREHWRTQKQLADTDGQRDSNPQILDHNPLPYRLATPIRETIVY